MTSLQLYNIITALRQLVKPTHISSHILGQYYEHALRITPKPNTTIQKNEVFSFVENYNIPSYARLLFFNITLLNSALLHESTNMLGHGVI
jgi:hypothetical protein